jgi:hypothetical protein
LARVRAWAYRAAVDLRRLHAREECAIETWIARKACLIALFAIDDRLNPSAVRHVSKLSRAS